MPTAYDPQYYTFTKQLVDVKPCIVFKFDSTEEYTDLLATQGLKRSCIPKKMACLDLNDLT